MSLNIKYQDILTLDDNNKYVVVSKVTYNNIDYIYLVDIYDTTNIKMAEIEEDCISILDDREVELINNLIPLFYEKSKNDIINN